MKKTARALANLILIGGLALAGTGCLAVLAAGAAAGGYAFYKGELNSTENVSLDRFWSATQSTVRSLNLVPTSETKDGLEAEMNARGADDRQITIKLKRVSADATEVRIRSGIVGDEDQARQILAAIRQKL